MLGNSGISVEACESKVERDGLSESVTPMHKKDI